MCTTTNKMNMVTANIELDNFHQLKIKARTYTGHRMSMHFLLSLRQMTMWFSLYLNHFKFHM